MRFGHRRVLECQSPNGPGDHPAQLLHLADEAMEVQRGGVKFANVKQLVGG